MPCVKIYLCSNPEDSVQERRALREIVFPKLRDHCRRTHGVDFRVIDPYEAHSPDDWPSQWTKLQLLQRCKDTSAGPYFMGLIGQQYGSASLPEQVETSEFQNILHACQSLQLNIQKLEANYRRDENVTPPSFCLLPSQQSSQIDAIRDVGTCRNALEELKDVFYASLKHCMLEGSIAAEKAQKYFRSDLENDLRFVAENFSSSDTKRCLCYVHKIINQRKDRQDASSDQMKALCDDFLPKLVTSCHLEVYTMTTECERRQGYTAALKQDYIEGLCLQVFTDLSRLVDCTVAKYTAQPGDASSQQASLCQLYSQLYRIERAEEQEIKAYVKQHNPKYPLVLTGGPCSGKTVLTAYCATQVKTWLKSTAPVIITQLLSHHIPLVLFLNSICSQIADCYDHPFDKCTRDVSQLKDAFVECLALAASSKRPLVLMFDGLDQVLMTEGLQQLTWLPSCLPPNVKMVISTTYTKSGTLATLKARYHVSKLFLDLSPFQKSRCSHMLTGLLKSSNRRITSGQQLYVNEALKQCPLPLYAELLYRQVNLWDSETEVTEKTLSQGVHNNIHVFLNQLEAKHGQELVCRSLSLLTLSRYGLTEAELTDILSCEDDLVSAFISPEDPPPYRLRFPEVVVERLLSDLEGFLVARFISGSHVLFWVSRHFQLVVLKRYVVVDPIDMSKEIHYRLANYFSGRWAYGRAKQLLLTPNANMESDKPATSDAVQGKFYIDRNPYGQPWEFPSKSSAKGVVNFRKVHELPYHLTLSEKLEELCRSVLLCFDFHHAMLKGGLVQELISWLEEISQVLMPRELRLLSCILRSSSCVLQNLLSEVPLILQSQLLPFAWVFPEMEGYVKQLCVENVRSGISMVLSPAPPVPHTSVRLPGKNGSSVTDVAASENGTIVLLFGDGSVWIWTGMSLEQLELPHGPTFQWASVRCFGSYILLSSCCKRLFLCKIDTMLLEEVPLLNTEFHQSSNVSVDGFLVFEPHIFWWYKQDHHVFMYTTNGDTSCNRSLGITLIPSTGFITSISSSYDGQFIFCGQDNGNVSVFDVLSNQSVSAISCPTKRPLVGLKLTESELMTCIDNVGSLYVWNIQSISSSTLQTEWFDSEDTEEVLNVDFEKNNHIVLICKRQKIILWSSCNCTVDDQFHAPKGQAFIQAFMDSDSHFLLALLEDSPSLLVWSLCTGQCILNLNTGGTAALKYLKVTGQHLSAVSASGMMTWDMELVRIAALTPKTGSKITNVLLVKDSDSFYTTDDGEVVWKWSAHTGLIEGSFMHHAPVTAVAISPDGEYLVTVASENIYVWRTVDGVNLLRITSGSVVSHILITPKGNHVVSLSDEGLSRVWKVPSGHVVCSFCHSLKGPVVSPESTFLLGLQAESLMAISLWSGYVSRQFPLSHVLAFYPVAEHPDYVIVITLSGAIYSWRMSEDTICQRFQMPEHLLAQTVVSQVSSDGNYALFNGLQSDINILDVAQGRFCTVNVNAPVQHTCLDIGGKYAAYICGSPFDHLNCASDPCVRFVLTAIQVSDGRKIGRFYLCRYPCAMSMSDNLNIYVGFDDGSVGIYAITDTEEKVSATKSKLMPEERRQQPCAVEMWQPLAAPNHVWADYDVCV
ncbi:NACHT and WD repeat domain-containing protein 2 [Engraulis encrasicolus]|uniref:NACHT and WD repeat domain-containing protein 2 n=1 Tax=Engraulis encrasicolus TaxID=184585 RepID=UPI002FCEB8F7